MTVGELIDTLKKEDHRCKVRLVKEVTVGCVGYDKVVDIKSVEALNVEYLPNPEPFEFEIHIS